MTIGTTKEVLINLITIKIFKEIKIIKVTIIIIINQYKLKVRYFLKRRLNS